MQELSEKIKNAIAEEITNDIIDSLKQAIDDINIDEIVISSLDDQESVDELLREAFEFFQQYFDLSDEEMKACWRSFEKYGDRKTIEKLLKAWQNGEKIK